MPIATPDSLTAASDDADTGQWSAAVRAAGHDIDACLGLARSLGPEFPLPGGGCTAQRWSMLASIAAIDLTPARVLEAHTDALAIMAEAGEHAPRGTWGVFAAEADDAVLLLHDGVLTGTKPWCSLGDKVDFALVTAREGDDRRLVAVDLRQSSVRTDPPDRWVAHGLREVTSVALHFEATPIAAVIGEAGWYLRRAGFAWGGMGVAACWLGGMLALQERLRTWARTRTGDLAALHLGVVDCQVEAAWASLHRAAQLIDSGQATGDAGALLALRVRAIVAGAAERVLESVGHALGPSALAYEEDHARRVADLGLYLRQHHAERDLAALGARSGIDSPLERIRRVGL